MKFLIRTTSLILALILLCGTSANAATANNEVLLPQASNFFTVVGGYVHKESSTMFEVWADTTAVRTMDELGVSDITIQRSSDGENWTNMYTYTKELYPHLVNANAYTYSGYISYSGSPGYYYRARICYYAKSGVNTGYQYFWTNSVKL